MGKKAGSGQRKVRSTAILGKSMAGLVKRSYAGKKALVENGDAENMPFYQTNPPFFGLVLSASVRHIRS
jgi:hypothetical protein